MSRNQLHNSKIPDSFLNAGIEDSNILLNESSSFVGQLVGATLTVVAFGLYLLRNKHHVFQLLFTKLSSLLFWNSTLRFFMESYVSLSFTSLFQANNGLGWTSPSEVA
jgi:hypothetical protein